MRKMIRIFCLLLLSYSLKAQTLPTMPPGGPDNGPYNVSGRHPAGNVVRTSFYSQVAGKNVEMWVYTPPGYNTNERYGVVYAYQGIGVDAGSIFYDWAVKAAVVCDNLIGDGVISKGVIIVALDDQFNGNNSNVADMTVRDAIPYIDSHYSTYADADHRGLYGYSWGGGYAFNVGCANLDYFHHLSPCAAAPNKAPDNVLFPNGGAYAKQVLKTLFISWGQYDYQSIIDANVACVNYLNANGVPHYSWVAQGQGHTASVWRPAMWNFLQLADRAGISSGSGGCNPTAITPYVQVNNGAWQQTSSVTVNSGTQVRFGPQPVSGGSWSWSGCGTSGSSREQTVSPTGTCTATATYTNGCGAQSTHTFTVNVNGSGGEGTFNGVYSFVAQHSGKAIDVAGGGTANGTNVQQWVYVASNNNERFQVTHLGSGWHRISPVIATGQALDVSGVSTANGANIHTWTYGGGNNQQWRFESAGNGYWKIIARHSNKCLDVSGVSTTDGANIHQWDCLTGAQNQAFQVIQNGSARLALLDTETLSNPSDDRGFSVYPNPSTGGDFTVNVSADNNESYGLSIFSADGKKVYEKAKLNPGQNEISTGLVKGMYFIKVGGANYLGYKKLMVK